MEKPKKKKISDKNTEREKRYIDHWDFQLFHPRECGPFLSCFYISIKSIDVMHKVLVKCLSFSLRGVLMGCFKIKVKYIVLIIFVVVIMFEIIKVHFYWCFVLYIY